MKFKTTAFAMIIAAGFAFSTTASAHDGKDIEDMTDEELVEASEEIEEGLEEIREGREEIAEERADEDAGTIER